MSYSQEQVAAFKARCRQGLSRCWTTPTAQEREINRRKMLADYRESQPELAPTDGGTSPPILPVPSRIEQTLQNHQAQLNYLQNKVMEKRVEQKKSIDYEPF